MELSAPRAMLTAWSELRLDLQPTASGSIVQTRLPERASFGRQNKGSRRVLAAYPACKSENEYSNRHVARSSGIHFRIGNKYPHNILWRCLGDDQTLELRSVDLSRPDSSEKSRDAPVILHFIFPTAIRNECVGFADSTHGDGLDVFVLTESRDLYTLSIRASWFISPDRSDEGCERWCRSARPSTLGVSQPLRMTSATSSELLFSMLDGRIIQLKRQPGSDGTNWTEIAYGEGQWSLRGLIPWQNTNNLKYEGNTVNHHSALEILPSPDGKQLILVTVSHMLRVFSLEQGKFVFERDILGIEHDPKEPSKMILDPGIRHVLAIDPIITPGPVASADQYYIITFSPHQGGNFKVWAVRDPDLGEAGGVQDLFPEQALQVPDPDDHAVWTVADFKFSADPSTHIISMWIMLRLNRRYKLFHKKFDSIVNLPRQWSDEWQQTRVADQAIPFETPYYTPPAPEPLGLALDVANGLPWLIHTDSVSPVRSVSHLEEIMFNPASAFITNPGTAISSIEKKHASSNFDLATLIEAAAQFRAGLSDLPLDDAVRIELWQDASYPTAKRTQFFYDQANFDQIDERVLDDIERSLGSIDGFEGLKKAFFNDILSFIPINAPETGRPYTDTKTSFGRKTIVTGAQKVSIYIERVITDLLYLLVYLEQALSPEDFPMAGAPTADVFEALVKRLRTADLAQWMATNFRSSKGRQTTMLEHRADPIVIKNDANVTLHTSIYELWADCTGDTEDVESPACFAFGDLLAHGDMRLASSFLRYLSSAPLPTYLRGRHALFNQEYPTAAIYLKKAAWGMSLPVKGVSIPNKTAHLVTPAEAESFGAGLAAYYTHVEALFSAPKTQAYVQSALFASLALQSLQLQALSKADSSLRLDLLARLFHATLHQGDYDAAFAALARYTDKALRRASLKELVMNMISQDAVLELLELPFSEAVKKEVDTILADRARKDTDNETERADAVKILYAWRVKRGDYRGAAACMVEKLQAQRSAGRKRPKVRATGKNDDVLNEYLISINSLSLLGLSEGVEDAENEGWLFVEKGDANGPRSLVRLKDLRREYQDEMDRREKWSKGQFQLTAADEEDEDGDAIMAT